MKVLCLIALIFASCAFFVNAQYSATSLTSGTAVTAISTSDTITTCNYYSLTVPANTGAVQIDLSSATSSSYVSITAGFNSFPNADRDTTNNGYSFLFSDNNVRSGSPVRYFLCTYDPTMVPGTSSSFPSTSFSSGCAAWVPDLHLGGKVVICVSSYSTGAITGVSLTATNIALTTTTAVGVSGTAVPVAASASSYSVTPYKFTIPSNSTGISVTTTSSSTVIQGPGLYSNAYTTGNSLSYGAYQIGTVYFMVIQSSTSAQSFTFTNTFQSCATGLYQYSSSSTCLNVTTLTSGTAQSLTYTTSASGGSYQLFQITAPTTVPTAKFYQLTVATTNNFVGTVYINGNQAFSLDSTAKAAGTFTVGYGGTSLVSGGTQSVTAHFFYPGSTVYIVLYSTNTAATTTLTATFANEASTNVVVGTTTISSSSGSATTATPATAQAYVTATPFTVTGSSSYLIKAVSSGLTTGTVSNQGLEVVSTDFKTVYVTLNNQGTTSNLYTTYIPANTLTSGSYYILTLPSGSSNARSVAFTSTSPSSSGSMTAPCITFLIAVIAFVMLAIN